MEYYVLGTQEIENNSRDNTSIALKRALIHSVSVEFIWDLKLGALQQTFDCNLYTVQVLYFSTFILSK